MAITPAKGAGGQPPKKMKSDVKQLIAEVKFMKTLKDEGVVSPRVGSQANANRPKPKAKVSDTNLSCHLGSAVIPDWRDFFGTDELEKGIEETNKMPDSVSLDEDSAASDSEPSVDNFDDAEKNMEVNIEELHDELHQKKKNLLDPAEKPLK